ncbi:MAG: DUF3034 family protein [Planctomycetota bacterium]|nr:DUF3034 family protein [Planctomycetota bacterium]
MRTEKKKGTSTWSRLARLAMAWLLVSPLCVVAAETKTGADQQLDPQKIREEAKAVAATDKDADKKDGEKKAEKAPPLPLHCIEGTGGLFATHTAYLVNPPKKGDIAGLPAVEGTYVNIGNGRHMTAFTLTENLAGRVELGYGWDHFWAGDLRHDIAKATGLEIDHNAVNLHNFNARGLLVKDGDFGKKWVPALTLGIHYKYNDTVSSLNDDLGGALKGIGIERRDGVDFTLYTTKMVTALPRPFLVSAGVRGSRAAHLGLLGFTNEYRATAEGNVAILLTNHFILAGEYRQKRSSYKEIPGLVEKERDWWTVDIAYILTKRGTLGAGYGHFGDVLNHSANGVWGVKFKWEF